MKIFATPNTRHLIGSISIPQGKYTLSYFSDGELFVRIDEKDLQNKKVWVIASTQTPASNLLELFFLLDALQKAGARISLFITYFAYARQVSTLPGEAHSAQIISNFLKTFTPEKTLILHAHSTLLHSFLSYEDVYDFSFFCEAATSYDALVAPDKGAYTWAQHVAKLCNKEIILMSKTRPDHDQVEIVTVEGNVTGKKLLIIDDIISTGRTLIQAAHELKKMGASSISAAAMHGILCKSAYQTLEKSILESIIVTNSTSGQVSSAKIKVHDISRFIADTIQTHIG